MGGHNVGKVYFDECEDVFASMVKLDPAEQIYIDKAKMVAERKAAEEASYQQAIGPVNRKERRAQRSRAEKKGLRV